MNARKKVVLMLVCVSLLLSLCAGCGGEPEVLEVWCSDGTQEFTHRAEFLEQQFNSSFDIDVTVFGQYYGEEGDAELTLELQNRLMAGDGPDLVLFQASDFRDVRKLAESGCFMDLSKFAEKRLNADDYVEGILQDGWYGSECWYIPLGFAVQSYVTVGDVLTENGWQEPKDFDEFLAQIDAYGENPNGYRYFLRPLAYGGQDGLFPSLFSASGVMLLDYETDTVLPDEDGLRRFLESYRIIRQQTETVTEEEIARLNESQWVGEHYTRRDYCYSVMDYPLFHALNLESISVEQDRRFGVIPAFDGETAGQVTVYAAISADSQNPEDALALLERMLGKTMQQAILTDFSIAFMLPVRKDCAARWLEGWNEDMEGSYWPDSSGELHPSQPLEEALCESYEMQAESAVAVYNSPVAVEMLWESMASYFEGTADYDTCLEELRGKLTLYAKE
ncbi:MAG: carbohydrate ABC transporter substrate-binding protein [Oscillospiraceae bacterium]|nr:carbohydrate ABC transporter substrate-binding protein [Oscillospiraceae bacterium]